MGKQNDSTGSVPAKPLIDQQARGQARVAEYAEEVEMVIAPLGGWWQEFSQSDLDMLRDAVALACSHAVYRERQRWLGRLANLVIKAKEIP